MPWSPMRPTLQQVIELIEYWVLFIVKIFKTVPQDVWTFSCCILKFPVIFTISARPLHQN